jgi:hypothetical protein
MNKQAQGLFDIFLNEDFQKMIRGGDVITDAEAHFLFAAWKQSPPGQDIVIPTNAAEHVNSLKAKGFLTSIGNDVRLTDKGRKVIVEMVTHVPNSFSKKAMPIYSKIKSAKKRSIQSLVKKTAGKDEKKSYNMRRESLRRLRGE